MGNRVTEGYITSVPLEIDLDINDFGKSARKLENMIEAIERGFILGVKELGDKSVEKLKENLGNYGLGNSMIAQTIDIDIYDEGLLLTVGADYAVYVEYGTGIVGANDPHPHPKITWEYDVNGHGEGGWWYPITDSMPDIDKRYLRYNEDEGIWYAFTRGQRSRPFMYDTWRWVRASAHNIINKNINRELRKLKGGLK